MLTENVKALQLIPASVRVASVNGSYFDLSATGGDNLMVTLDIGTVTGTTPTLDVKVQDADDTAGTGVADLAGAVFAQKVATGIFRLNVNKGTCRKAIRIVCTIAGTTPSFPVSVVGHIEAKASPVTAQA